MCFLFCRDEVTRMREEKQDRMRDYTGIILKKRLLESKLGFNNFDLKVKKKNLFKMASPSKFKLCLLSTFMNLIFPIILFKSFLQGLQKRCLMLIVFQRQGQRINFNHI